MPKVIEQTTIDQFQPKAIILSAIEGEEQFKLHRFKERNSGLVEAKKYNALQQNPKLPCEVCGLSFLKMYGEVGKGFIEAHHIIPLSELNEATETKLEDLILLCANCHRMIHKIGNLEGLRSSIVSK